MPRDLFKTSEIIGASTVNLKNEALLGFITGQDALLKFAIMQ
jgi:hypothetical protein